MRIFYIGSSALGGTSRHRATALERLGHQVTILDPYSYLRSTIGGRVASRIHYNTGYRWAQSAVASMVDSNTDLIADHEVVWVDSGELLGPKTVSKIRRLGPRVVLFNADDPTGGRDGARFDSLLRSVPHYDLCVTVRDETCDELRALGARVIKTWRGCDEVVHAPLTNAEREASPFGGGIVFVGTWMRGENRDTILSALVEAGLPVSIWGDRWQRSRAWPILRESWKGGALIDRNYTTAIASADACLGFLSAGNRDLHTHRSLEVPYIGAVLIAERTSEHLKMYNDGTEALFWDNAQECISQCERILGDARLRNGVRAAALARSRSLGVGNETIVASILDELMRQW